MKTYITKGSGINRLNTRVKINPETGKAIRGQFNENKFLIIENAKYWEKEKVSGFYAHITFIFNFPQRKIKRALKEKK
jgi:hypothetical protein